MHIADAGNLQAQAAVLPAEHSETAACISPCGFCRVPESVIDGDGIVEILKAKKGTAHATVCGQERCGLPPGDAGDGGADDETEHDARDAMGMWV